MKKTEIPAFGPLNGLKVVHAAVATAGTVAAQLLADWGAEVTWLENALAPDTYRYVPLMIEQDRRNQRNLSLNIPSPEGREIFFKLIADADIFIEASKGGQYAGWGLTDEVLWQHNPKLVILHITGYGLTGLPDYISRASYDPIAQAFGGLMQMNGYADRKPVPESPSPVDYWCSYMGAASCLAGVYKAQKTGKGESVDMAQYEITLRSIGLPVMEEIMLGKKYVRQGDRSTYFGAYGVFDCSDGKAVFINGMSPVGIRKICGVVGIEYGKDPLFPEGLPLAAYGTPAGTKITEKLEEYCAKYTADEVNKAFNAVGVPCSKINDFEALAKDPQAIVREAFTEWENAKGEKITGVNIVPKFKVNPCKTWRGAPDIGADNEDILSEIGYSPEQIQELYAKKIIAKI